MVLHGVLAKAATTVVTGAVGVAAYDALRKAVAKMPIREASVTTAEWALRGARKAEETAETARLNIADVMAEARERIGEEVPPPAVAEPEHTHEQ
jgi:putative Ca2+/H+ antiporter (TMEM165/GDT1 family)